MVNTLQPVLVCGQGSTSDMTIFSSSGGKSYDVYLGLALLERVSAAPESVQRKMLIGRLHNQGVRLGELRRNFGHDNRTIRKWGKALCSDDASSMAVAFAGRGGVGKVTPAMIRYACQLYRERHLLGKNYRQIIVEKIREVFQVSLSGTSVSEMFRHADALFPVVSESSSEKAIAVREDPVSSVDDGESVKWSPILPPFQEWADGFCGSRFLHHAGQVLFASQLSLFSDPLQRQFIAQILQGAVNIDQSKTLCMQSLSLFTEPLAVSHAGQRDGLDRQADPEAVMEIYRMNSQLLADGPNRGDVFYFDTHTKEYTGELKILKGWCGRRHAVAKVINLDSFHTVSGRPCFIQHYSSYYDMRERFFISLRLFNTLFEPDKCSGRTFVIDRGIYGLATLQLFTPDYFITWEKGYSAGGWNVLLPAVSFSRCLTKNHRDDHRPLYFECQEKTWHRQPDFRQILVRVSRDDENWLEVGILTSNPQMDLRDVVWFIFRRWLQENDFKYLDRHFGLNQMTSRDSMPFRKCADQLHDRPAVCPEYKEMKDALQTLEARLGRLLVRQRRADKTARDLLRRQQDAERARAVLQFRMQSALEQAVATADPGDHTQLMKEADRLLAKGKNTGRQIAKNAVLQEKLKGEISELEAVIDPLAAKICQAVRTDSRLQLLIAGDYQVLDTRKKAFMDALRVTAANIFRNVQGQFRAIYNNYRDDHVLIREISRSKGILSVTADTVELTLCIPGNIQKHKRQAFCKLLAKVQQHMNSVFQKGKRIILKTASGPVKL